MDFSLIFWFSVTLKLLTFLQVGGESACPKPPSIVADYVSYRVHNIAEPFYIVALFWTHIRDGCEDGSGEYYEILSCDKSDCVGDFNFTKTSLYQSPRTVTQKGHVEIGHRRPEYQWLYVKVRAVNRDHGNQSDWSDVYTVDLTSPNPEPYLLTFYYFVGDTSSQQFQLNPYGVYLHTEFIDYSKWMPPRLATSPWPMLFDYECCDSEGIAPAPADPDALYFQLSEEILKIKEKESLNVRVWVTFDWVSAYHFTVIKYYDHYYIYKVDESDLVKSGDPEKTVVIYETTNRIYQVLYNSMASLLFWTERETGNTIQIKVKFMGDREQTLAEKCPCVQELNFTSPAIELDWRPFYYENGTQPGLLFLANNSLWRADSILDTCTCEQLIADISNVTDGDDVIQMSSDWSNFYWMNGNGHLKGYNWKSGSVKFIWDDSTNKKLGYITQFRANGAELRPFSPVECYYPTFQNVTATMVSNSEAIVRLNLTWNQSEVCRNIPRPLLDYSIEYGQVKDGINETALFTNLSCQFFHCDTIKLSWSREYENKQFTLKNLHFNKTYFLSVSVSPTNQYPKGFYPYDKEAEVHEQIFTSLFVPKIKKHIPVKAVVATVAILLLLIVALAIFIVIYFRKFQPVKDIPRISRSHLKPISKISEGNFGEVWRETLRNKATVAVKYLKPTARDYEERCFLQEMHIMWCAKGPNIVELLGICLTSRPYRMVVEFIDGTSLICHLRHLKSEKYSDPVYSYLQKDDERDIVKAMLDTSKACVHLETLAILHRDLAGRNVMLTFNSNTGRIEQVKLIDFGLAKEIDTAEGSYSVPKGVYRELPAALFSPEAFATWVFTPKTEVWAFGVLLWETFSLGDTPYAGKSFEDIEEFLGNGHRLQRPHHCSNDRVYTLIQNCWDTDPKKRPDFKTIQNELEDVSKHPFKPSALVYPQTSRSVSEMSKKSSVPHSGKSLGSLGVPSQAYAEMRIIGNPSSFDENIEMQERGEMPLVAKVYRGSEKQQKIPKMTGAYVEVQQNEGEMVEREHSSDEHEPSRQIVSPAYAVQLNQ